jgi:hypothetical protein
VAAQASRRFHAARGPRPGRRVFPETKREDPLTHLRMPIGPRTSTIRGKSDLASYAAPTWSRVAPRCCEDLKPAYAGLPARPWLPLVRRTLLPVSALASRRHPRALRQSDHSVGDRRGPARPPCSALWELGPRYNAARGARMGLQAEPPCLRVSLRKDGVVLLAGRGSRKRGRERRSVRRRRRRLIRGGIAQDHGIACGDEDPPRKI